MAGSEVGSASCAAAGPVAASVAGDGADAADPPARDVRRARAWYSGPCLRGSAYSLGLVVQYVPLEVPYQLAPKIGRASCRERVWYYV